MVAWTKELYFYAIWLTAIFEATMQDLWLAIAKVVKAVKPVVGTKCDRSCR